MKKSKVIVLGSLAFDYIMTFSEKFINAVTIDHEKEKYQSTITAEDKEQFFGGTAGNIAYNLGLLNAVDVSIFGVVGRDFESLGYKDHISRFKNIELNVDIHENSFTACCYIVNDIKANQMIIFHGGALEKCKDLNLKERIDNPGDYIYAINSTQSVDAMENFANQLHELGIPMIFDPGQVTPLFPKEILMDVIKKSEILIGNNYEIGQVISKIGRDKHSLLKYLKALIITRGEQGSELIYKDESNKIHDFTVPIVKPRAIVDTTGAGDGYRAGILTGLILNMTLLDSCRLGSVISSFVVETQGAQTHSFDILDVRKRFYESFGYIPKEIARLK
ncbi:MAG: carbohydrate kinase family protein [Promethearchaeota archaeon]